MLYPLSYEGWGKASTVAASFLAGIAAGAGLDASSK